MLLLQCHTTIGINEFHSAIKQLIIECQSQNTVPLCKLLESDMKQFFRLSEKQLKDSFINKINDKYMHFIAKETSGLTTQIDGRFCNKSDPQLQGICLHLEKLTNFIFQSEQSSYDHFYTFTKNLNGLEKHIANFSQENNISVQSCYGRNTCTNDYSTSVKLQMEQELQSLLIELLGHYGFYSMTIILDTTVLLNYGKLMYLFIKVFSANGVQSKVIFIENEETLNHIPRNKSQLTGYLLLASYSIFENETFHRVKVL